MNAPEETTTETNVGKSPPLVGVAAAGGAEEASLAAAKVRAEDDQTSTTRDALNHSNRRVIVHNVLKFEDNKGMRKITAQWMEQIKQHHDGDIEIEKIKKPPKETWVVLTLKDPSHCQPFIDFINQNDITNKRGGKLFAKYADDNDNDQKKRSNQKDGFGPSKRRRVDDTPARRPVTEEEIKNKVTPLWKLSEEEQRNKKLKEMIRKCAMKIVQDVKGRFRKLGKDKNRKKKVECYKWLEGKRCIEIEDVVSAPTPLRNKSEFTFGYRYLFDKNKEDNNSAADEKMEDDSKLAADEKKEGDQSAAGEKKEDSSSAADEKMEDSSPAVDEKKEESSSAADETKEGDTLAGDDKMVGSSSAADKDAVTSSVPAVGFMVTGWAGGVCRPHCCQNIPPEVCKLVDIFDDFLSSSLLAPYDTKVHKGFWRTLTVRTSRRTKECMVIIIHTPPSGGAGEQDEPFDYSDDFQKERARLVSVLQKAELDDDESSPLKVTSIFFQEFAGLSHPPPHHPVQHVYGKKFLEERLGQCTFQISPGAFFQVNTEGAEMLYQIAVDKVRQVATEPENTLLFDVCCGTGTIGLTCMKEGKLIGVDISEPAIEDAKKNAEINGFSTGDSEQDKTRFIASRAEQVLHKEIGKAKKENPDMKFVAVVDPAREGLHADVVRTLRSNERIRRIVYVSCSPTGSLVRDAALLCQPPTKKYTGRAFRISSASPVDMFPLTDHCEMVMVFDRLSADEVSEEE